MSGGVSATDACLTAMDGFTPLVLKLPAYSREDATPVQKRASARKGHLVFWHDLYPIIPPRGMDMSEAAVATTNDEWLDAGMVGYRRCTVDAAAYYAMIGRRGLFGDGINPIDSIVRLTTLIHSVDVLMHYVLAVALQYYLIVRRAFLRVRTDGAFDFNEAMPPYVFMLFKHSDWSIDSAWLVGGGMATLDADSSDSLEAAAAAHPFPVFLVQVFGWIMRAYPALSPHGDKFRAFCTEKLRKNYIQSLTCMRFREVVPPNMARLLGGTASVIKFFAHPKACRMPSVDAPGMNAPQIFCHVFFSPVEPVLFDDVADESTLEIDTQRHLLWRLLLYYPLSAFKQTVDVAAKRMWATASPTTKSVFPTTPMGKFSEYDAFIQLSPVRARYTMYFRRDEAFAFVPNLLLPEIEIGSGIVPHDEMDLRHMSREAWEWCVNRGAMQLTTSLERPHPSDTPFERFVVHELVRYSSIDRDMAWVYYWYILWSTKSEEYACYMSSVVYEFTLDDLRASYDAFAHDATRQILAFDRAAESVAAWDRCTRVRFIADCSEFAYIVSWRFLFPVSVIVFGGCAWSQSWSAAQPFPLFCAAISSAMCMLSKPGVLKELRENASLSPDPRIVRHMEQAMAILHPQSDVVLALASFVSHSD